MLLFYQIISSISETPKDRNSIQAFEVLVKDGAIENSSLLNSRYNRGSSCRRLVWRWKGKNITGYNWKNGLLCGYKEWEWEQLPPCKGIFTFSVLFTLEYNEAS